MQLAVTDKGMMPSRVDDNLPLSARGGKGESHDSRELLGGESGDVTQHSVRQ